MSNLKRKPLIFMTSRPSKMPVMLKLKTSLKDSLASAANYISKIGWKKNEPCFYQVKLNKKVKKKYINSSARNIKKRLKMCILISQEMEHMLDNFYHLDILEGETSSFMWFYGIQT